MALQPRWPVCFGRTTPDAAHFRIWPALGLFSHSSLQLQKVTRIRINPRILASSDHSKGRSRRIFVPKTASTPKGFSPRQRVRTSTQKKDQNDAEEKEASEESSSSVYRNSSSRLTEKEITGESQATELGSSSNMSDNVAERKFSIMEEKEQRSWYSDEIDKKSFAAIRSADTDDSETDGQIAELGNEGDGDGIGLRSQGKAVDHNDKEIGKDCTNEHSSDVGKEMVYVKDQIDRISTAEKTGIAGEEEKKLAIAENNLDICDIEIPSKVHNSTVKTMLDTEESLLEPKEDIAGVKEKNLAVVESNLDIGDTEVPGEVHDGTTNTTLDTEESLLEPKKDIASEKEKKLAVAESDLDISAIDVPGEVQVSTVNTMLETEESLLETKGGIKEKKLAAAESNLDITDIEVHGVVHDVTVKTMLDAEGSLLEPEEDIAGVKEEKPGVVRDSTVNKMSNAEESLPESKEDIADEKLKKLAVAESILDINDIGVPGTAHDSTVNMMLDAQESSVEPKVDMDAEAHKQLLENLADENFSRGNKVFVVPEMVNPDRDIEIFLNRSLSTLAMESNVFIKGAYNGWRWKSFTEKLQKTDLRGDCWSCRLSLPKEAYKVDFVFFNGDTVYENNNYKDFTLPVEGGMDESAFEDFLLEEERKELEKIAAKQAEKEREAEEQRRRESEKAANEAVRTEAKLELEKRRHGLHHVMKLALESANHLWQIEPSVFKGGDRIRLYYNRSSRPLAHATEIWIHGGHNSWGEGSCIIERLSRSQKADGDWWSADVVVPDQALVLDWVFADGPPGKAFVYDNNNKQDFHATVPKSMPEELFWVEEEHRIYRKLQEDRKSKEEAVRKKAEKTAHMKAETKDRTMKMFLLSQKHIVYTEPINVQAGNMVSVLYNPSKTVLNGKTEVWFRCSFNRWSHRNVPLPPQKMVPADNGSHFKATVKVPMDAYMMDFVFSEREDGGIYDNKNGMDYHIPVSGGITKETPMHIVHIAVEMAPIAKVGGLGDVVTSLSRAVQDLGQTVDIVLPKYNCMNFTNVKDLHYRNSFAWSGTEIKIWFGKVEGLSVYFLEPQNGMFSVGCIYGRNDDGHRFGFFCHAALEFLLQSGFQPDILHCHDWSSAPVAWLFKEHYSHYGLSNSRVIFTIHNIEFGLHNIGRAVLHADKATTVSQTYSREVAGNRAISPHLRKFHGIVNGIDPDIWDPYNDHFIPVPYTPENVVEGKKAAKEALQERLGLRKSDYPLVGIITRLTFQKGIHLIKHAIWQTLERNGQVVLLGSAPDSRIQNDFVNLANKLHSSHGDRARLCLTYDEPLSHLIYAAADFILVPSIFEPCGLTQLTAMRYGSIPVVRKTGGLYDTVFDVDNDKERAQAQGLEPNGFNFDGADSAGVDYALNRAISAWYDAREWFYSLCKRVMEQDWSWNRPALDYMELYHAARK